MKKPELRKIYKAKRFQLYPAEIQQLSFNVLENLKRMDIWDFSVYHIFLPIAQNHEINTFPIIDELFSKNKRVVVPKVSGSELINCEIQKETEFEIGKFKTLEPKEIQLVDNKLVELVFMPMMVCDKNGNRVGYGGGFYDRWLSQFEKKPVKIGLNFFPPVDEIQDAAEWDVRLDYSVTPDEIVSFMDSGTSASSEK